MDRLPRAHDRLLPTMKAIDDDHIIWHLEQEFYIHAQTGALWPHTHTQRLFLRGWAELADGSTTRVQLTPEGKTALVCTLNQLGGAPIATMRLLAAANRGQVLRRSDGPDDFVWRRADGKRPRVGRQVHWLRTRRLLRTPKDQTLPDVTPTGRAVLKLLEGKL